MPTGLKLVDTRRSQVRRLTAAGDYKPFVKLLSSNGTKIAELQTRFQQLLSNNSQPTVLAPQTCLRGTFPPPMSSHTQNSSSLLNPQLHHHELPSPRAPN